MKQLGHTIGLATELGITMGFSAASPVILGLLAGRWLDQQFGSKSAFTVGLVLLGAVVGQVVVYRLVISSIQRMSDSGATPHPFSTMRKALRTLAIVALSPLVGLGVGFGLDRWWGSGALVTLVLALGGLAVGLVIASRRTRQPAPPQDTLQEG